MCGRFSLDASIDVLIERYKAMKSEDGFEARDEIFPTNVVPIVVKQDNNKLRMMKWGFMPHYAKKPLINARAETVDEKPSFRNSFYNRRCIIPVTSFYEWENIDNNKIRRRISIDDEEVFSLAGLYNIFSDKEGNKYEAFTIITTDSNDYMKKIHHRMPVIIPKNMEYKWLNISYREIDEIKSLMKPYNGKMTII